MEINQLNESIGQKLLKILNANADSQFVQCPCKVTAVSSNGNYVDVLPIINDDEINQELYDVKIRHLESSTAFIFLGVHKGDRGLLRFFDRSIENYSINGSEEYNEDDRIHNDNDGLFELGFVPDSESYIYPSDKEIVIGLKNQKFTLSVDNDGKLNILGQGDVDINITGSVNQTVNGDVNLTATNINSSGNLTHTGNATINGALTATTVIAQNGSTGTYANQVTTENGIVISGS